MSQLPSTSTPPTNFETIFQAALKAYKKQTKKDITSHPLAAQLQSCDSPGAILSVLQNQVQTLDQSQSADERWTKWLDPTVNVLYAFSATLGNGVGLVFPPANAIFTGIGVLLQAVKDVRASQDTLADLFGHMEFFFKRLEAYLKIRPTAAMTDIIVKIMVEVILILGIVTKEIGRGRTKKYLKKLFGKLFGRDDIEGALQRLDRLMPEEARMATAETLTISRGIDDKVNNVDEKLDGVGDEVKAVDHKVGSAIRGVKENGVAIQQVVNQVTDLNWNELRKDLRKWIAPPDPSVNFNTASDAHHEGTSTWCTNGNTVANWKSSGSLLWIHGKPGSGKSILSSVIIRDIESMSNDGSAFLAYFYFDFKDTSKQDSRALLSSLLIQLSDQSDIFCDALSSLYSVHKRGSVQPTNDSLSECLKNMVMVAGQVPIYLIMDALDECPNDSGIPSSREKVLKLVKEFVDLRHPNLRLCVTSRPEFDIRTKLEPLATQQLSLHDEKGQRQDIIDYVTSVIRSDEKTKRWRGDDKNMVIEKLTEKADGMFRWVFCQLEVLRHCFPSNLRRTLEELPKSLDDTYKRILNEINNANQEHAYRLLQCLVVALRPLRVEELAEVLAVDFNAGGIPELKSDWRWEDQEEAVLSACSSLVSIIIDDGDRIVQFSHFSVKEFLTSDRLANPLEEVSRFHIPVEPSHAVLAQACLGVLLRLDDHSDKESVERIPLYQYAARYWYPHAQNGNVELQIKDTMDYFFDMDKPHFSAWVRIQGLRDLTMVSYSEQPRAVPLSAAPLYFAAWRGFRGLVGRLISKHPQQVNQSGGVYGTALHASVQGGDIEIAQLLFAHGANINSRSADNDTPLHFASSGGHVEVGKWLMKLGADVNPQEKDGLTPLHLTALNGHIDIVQILLERNADLNSRDNHGCTPLLLALQNRQLNIARLLLDHNADVHLPGSYGATPLHKAASNGHLKVARILLERNAEVNSRDDHGSTPLHLASRDGHHDIVQLLLNLNADAHIPDNSGATPLHKAATKGHLEVIRILLERNVEVNSQDNDGSTPLLLASQNGHPDVAHLLLGHNADVHVCAKSRVTPLHSAAASGHLEVARILLEHNAEVNSQNDDGSTPLLLASQNGHTDVVRLLLDHNADADLPGSSGVTPLHLATTKGHLEIARILLERNADANSLDVHGCTPLLLALQNGHRDVSRLLLDHNSEAHVPGSSQVTPLQLAVTDGHFEFSRILLEHNAEINSEDDHGYTPLLLALQNGHLNIARLLMDHSLDARVPSSSRVTPLHKAATNGHLEVARILLEHNAEVNSQDYGESTPLLFASENGHLDVVQLLLDHNADAHIRNVPGNTPLHRAALNGHLEVARLLLERNAEVDPRNDHRSTPLLLASEDGHLDVVRLLLDHNADVHARDNDGDTLLHCAAIAGRSDVARLLLEINAEVNSLNKNGLTPLHYASEGSSYQPEGHPDVVRLLLDHGADAQVRNLKGSTASEVARGPKRHEIIQLLSQHAEE